MHLSAGCTNVYSARATAGQLTGIPIRPSYATPCMRRKMRGFVPPEHRAKSCLPVGTSSCVNEHYRNDSYICLMANVVPDQLEKTRATLPSQPDTDKKSSDRKVPDKCFKNIRQLQVM